MAWYVLQLTKQLAAMQEQACSLVVDVLMSTTWTMWRKCGHAVCLLPDRAGAAEMEASTPLAGAAAGAGKGPWTSK